MSISALVGKTLTDVSQIDDEEMVFKADSETYRMLHYQDCCESVYIEDVNGDLSDLIGTPILIAEEREENNPSAGESGTWTFYTLRTIKGSVDIRWNGESNGYYSESVDFVLDQSAPTP